MVDSIFLEFVNCLTLINPNHACVRSKLKYKFTVSYKFYQIFTRFLQICTSIYEFLRIITGSFAYIRLSIHSIGSSFSGFRGQRKARVVICLHVVIIKENSSICNDTASDRIGCQRLQYWSLSTADCYKRLRASSWG